MIEQNFRLVGIDQAHRFGIAAGLNGQPDRLAAAQADHRRFERSPLDADLRLCGWESDERMRTSFST